MATIGPMVKRLQADHEALFPAMSATLALVRGVLAIQTFVRAAVLRRK